MSDHLPVSPSADDVRDELDRILTSEAFANTGRLARLLRFVVERSLAGEGDQLKEYVLGVEVFDRGDQYDPRLDSIVRVEARRLRGKLDEYYRNSGASDNVVINIPRGGYAPVFRFRALEAGQKTAPPPPARVTRPVAVAIGLLAIIAIAAVASLAWRSTLFGQQPLSIAVLPFEEHSGTLDGQRLAARLTDNVTSELARLGSVSVVSRTSARQFEGTRTPLGVIAKALNANLVMESTLETGQERVKVTARLVNAATDRKVWADVFEAPSSDTTLARRIAIAAAAAAAQLK